MAATADANANANDATDAESNAPLSRRPGTSYERLVASATCGFG